MKDAGLTNVTFHESSATEIPDQGYDFACIFDALHDMGDLWRSQAYPPGALEDGTFMLVEPMSEALFRTISKKPDERSLLQLFDPRVRTNL